MYIYTKYVHLPAYMYIYVYELFLCHPITSYTDLKTFIYYHSLSHWLIFITNINMQRIH
uniref:Uncharacterized protein n=1 Tax=Anguilla anguilla TaxID=7936 RepID=A0A0E9Q0B0_ANGAN